MLEGLMTEEERIAKEYELFKEAYEESKIKECFYFDHTHCDKRIISAHSIQKSKILKHISKDGMVIAIKKSIENNEISENDKKGTKTL